MDHSRPPTISSLATEIIELIAGKFLETRDICSLRATCRALCQKTSHTFGQTFAALTSDLSLTSLQKLQEISKNNLIKKHVRHLDITEQGIVPFGKGYIWNRHISGRLIPPFPAISALEDLLVNEFTNCHSFHVQPSVQQDRILPGPNHLSTSDIITLLFYLASNTKIRPKAFGITVMSTLQSLFDRQMRSSSDDTKDEQMPSYWNPNFLALLAELHEFNFNFISFGGLRPGKRMIKILAHMINLRTLTLKTSFEDSEKFMYNFSSAAPTYPNLQELRLLSSTISSESFLRILFCCKNTLRTLHLWFIVMPSGQGTWASVFTEMAANLPVLESLRVEHLQGGRAESDIHGYVIYPKLKEDKVIPGTDGQLLDLVYKKKKGAKQVVGVDYQGQFVSEVLKRLADTTEYLADVPSPDFT